MINCNKQQKEVYKGTPQTRCINPEADSFQQLVPPAVCAACPLVQLRVNPCAHKDLPVPVKTVILSKSEFTRDDIILLSGTAITPPGYPECPYRDNSGDGYKCGVTHLQVTQSICNKCDEDTRTHSATFGEKVKHYFGAVRRWVAHGRPTRSATEIEALFEEHCSKCKRYDPVKHSCKNCGCVVSTDSTPLKNKLAMATEPCPLGRF